MQNYTYDEIFQRNIGIFTPEEQEKIKNLKIAIIGVGGLGGPVAESLARLGVGELRLVEPDTFEVSNLNRQTGAYLDTIGRNKADVLAEMAQRINPDINITVKKEKVFGNELKLLIEGCSIVVDGIDYFNIDDEIELHKLAKAFNIPIVTGQGCFNIQSFSYFDPKRAMLSDLITSEDYIEKIMQATGMYFPILPKELTEEVISGMVQSYLAGQSTFAMPSYSINGTISGVIVSKFILDILINTNLMCSVPVMPDILYIDTDTLEFERVVRG